MNNLRITLVDDDSIFCFLFKKLIEQYPNLSIDLEIFPDGYSAAESLRNNKGIPQNQPQLLFIDINMPLMNGWELLETIYKEELLDNEQVKMYIISSSISKADLDHSKIGIPPISYLTKPITFSTLFREIEAYNSNFPTLN